MTTDQIEIYVRSSPLGPVGIHWCNVSKPEQTKEDPEILAEQVVPDGSSKISIDSAINTVKPCLVLAKYNSKVLLEVTGIDATPDRSEKLGRRISEVVFWVGDDNEETEKQLRKLACCALTGLWIQDSKFRKAISASIEFDGLNNYKVDADRLQDIYKHPENYTEEKFLNLETENSLTFSLSYLEPHKLETDEEIAQFAEQLRQASFSDLETAVVIAEVKQTEIKRWLNHRGNVAELPPKSEPSMIIQEAREDVSPENIDSLVWQPKSEQKKKIPRYPKSSLRIVLAIVLLIFLITLWLARKQIPNILPSQPPPQPVQVLMKIK